MYLYKIVQCVTLAERQCSGVQKMGVTLGELKQSRPCLRQCTFISFRPHYYYCLFPPHYFFFEIFYYIILLLCISSRIRLFILIRLFVGSFST